MISPGNGAALPWGEVTVSWWAGPNETTTSCVDWTDSNKCSLKETTFNSFDFGQRRCGKCSSAAGVTALGGSFQLWGGPSPGAMTQIPGPYQTSGGGATRGVVSASVPRASLPLGGNYYWQVRAVNEVGYTAASPTWSFSLVCTGSGPSAPTLQSPSNGAALPDLTLTLSWTAPTDWGTDTCTTGQTYDIYLSTANPPLYQLASLPASQTTLNFTGVRGTTYYWQVAANNGRTQTRSPIFSVTLGVAAWFGGAGGDITAGSALKSLVWPGKLFINDAAGVAIAGGSVDLAGQPASNPGWVVANSPLSTRLLTDYNFAYLKSRILATANPTVISGPITNLTKLIGLATPVEGVYYVRSTGNVDVIADIDLGDNQIVWLAEEGDVHLQGRLNLNDNRGLLVIVASGNINIGSNVGTATFQDPATLSPHLEGIFIAGGTVDTGAGNNQLRVDGSVVGLSGVNLQRQYISPYPGEYFVFRPDLVMRLPKTLLRPNRLWEEVAP